MSSASVNEQVGQIFICPGPVCRPTLKLSFWLFESTYHRRQSSPVLQHYSRLSLDYTVLKTGSGVNEPGARVEAAADINYSPSRNSRISSELCGRA
jgi:hypothetical protein